MALGAHKNLCTVLIPLCKNNLNLLMYSSLFSALCLVASSSPLSCCHACYLALLIFLFIYFHRNQFCSPAINQISLSQSKDWFPIILLCIWEKYHWKGLLGLRTNYTNRISGSYQHAHSLKNYLNVINICISLVHIYIYIMITNLTEKKNSIEESKQTLKVH